MQRLRILFSRGEEVKFISHLDIIRLWQRVLHRAEIPLAYSEGFNPHPRISLAVPLSIGVTSEAELMDVFCTGWVSPHFFTDAVNKQLPGGMSILQVQPVGLTLPSLQSMARFAEYKVVVTTEKEQKEVEASITRTLSLKELPWQHMRDTGPRKYDLRILIDNLWLIEWQQDYVSIGMKLSCDNRGSGRPEQVASALGYPENPESIHRTRLILQTS